MSFSPAFPEEHYVLGRCADVFKACVYEGFGFLCRFGDG